MKAIASTTIRESRNIKCTDLRNNSKSGSVWAIRQCNAEQNLRNADSKMPPELVGPSLAHAFNGEPTRSISIRTQKIAANSAVTGNATHCNELSS